MLLPIADDLRVERLSRAEGTAQGGEVIFSQILLREQAVNGRRCTESGNFQTLDQVQMKMRIKGPLPVIEYDLRSGEQRRKQQTPGRLRPAGIGQRPVHIALTQVHPEKRRRRMGERITEIPRHHFRHRGGAGGEIGHHHVRGDGWRRVFSRQRWGGLRHQFIKGEPARVRAADDDKMLKRRTVAAHGIDFLAMLRRDHDKPRLGLLYAIGDILRGQQVRPRHRNRAHLHAGEKYRIPFRDSANDKAAEIALIDPEGQERVCQPRGILRIVGIADIPDRLSVPGNRNHRHAIILGRAGIDNIEGEVEIVRNINVIVLDCG